MHDLDLTAASGTSQLTAVVVGHCARKLPRPVEAVAARLAAGTISGPQTVVSDDGTFLLVKPEAKPWLTGGEEWRVLGAQIVDGARAQKVAAATVLVEGAQAKVEAIAEGCLLGDYRFDLLRSGEAAKRPRLTVRIPGFTREVAAGAAIAKAQNLARELADLPGNLLNPQTFAARAVKELRGSGARVRVISGTVRLRRAGFPGLAQVGQAGSAEPQLVEIRYVPAKAKRGAPHLAIVGKGITFDSGGISLKPGDKMWEMKGDMSGAAATLAAVNRIVREKPDYPVSAFLCLAENMPDSRAQRPGDIYRARNGKTIHVDNTDAEGRLVLADVLTYAAETGATHMVDLATLTGACVVALGEHVAGALGRHDEWTRQVREAGQAVGEELWPLPLHGEYRKLLDHAHADINNIGGRYGGALTAGIFLSEFVPAEVKWVHLDIAGPAMATSGWRFYAKGFTGFGTRTLIELARGFGKR
ncbi:MAG TPA: aminopeptidase [Planctomycetes bacterium]|nr:aminopeptidase [Planctomycetota bacterium]